MHEMGIANSILEGVAKELERRPGTRPLKVGVRIGALAGVDPDALSFAFEALTLDTDFAGLAIDIEYVAPRSRCRECSREFEVRNYELFCPACGSLNTERLSGDEMEFTYLEIEEPESDEIGRAEPQLAEARGSELRAAESKNEQPQARAQEVEKQ
jgi:hydrogenase nickel incorporation protein HypA/HybF